MRHLRRLLLVLFILLPLVTLVHRDVLGRWDVQRSAMAGPDEFSYLLMADHFLRGGGLSLKEELGRDTFYPPGYPLLIAAWCKVVALAAGGGGGGVGEVTAFRAHALNAALLCIDTLAAYLFTRRLLGTLARRGHRRFHYGPEAQAWLALVVAGLFAANWHILETSLLIMSEPAFMLATFAWLAMALRWRTWHRHVGQAVVVGFLAVAAWSIRGAGITCVAATLLYPIVQMAGDAWRAAQPPDGPAASPRPWRRELPARLAALGAVLLLIIAYQGFLRITSPEKALASGQSANSYTDQLIGGLTDGHRLHFSRPADYGNIALNLRNLIFDHFADYASSFVPWPRENPDWHFRNVIGKVMGILGLTGWLWHATRWQRDREGSAAAKEETGSMRFLELFVLLYIGLYLVWPFSFARFWSPLLPLMLVYAADAVVRFSTPRRGVPVPAAAILLLGLLLVLSVVEARVQLGNYARRLNYVSDALAGAARGIMKRSPDPAQTFVAVMDGDDHFAMAWYFSQAARDRAAMHSRGVEGRRYRVYSPEPHVAAKGGAGETVEELVLRLLRELAPSTRDTLPGSPAGGGVGRPGVEGRIYLFSYFKHRDAAGVFSNLQRRNPEAMAGVSVEKVIQQEIITAVWEMRRDGTRAPAP